MLLPWCSMSRGCSVCEEHLHSAQQSVELRASQMPAAITAVSVVMNGLWSQELWQEAEQHKCPVGRCVNVNISKMPAFWPIVDFSFCCGKTQALES